MKKKVVVFGGSGFLGSHVAKDKVKLHAHYVRTPYTVKEPLVMKFNEKFHVDIGQGLSNLIKELQIVYKKK